jgi:oligopeptide transport system permease protein
VALAVLLLAGWLIAHEQKTLAGFSTFQTVFSDYVRAVILPVATIGIGMSAGIARMTRASLLEVLGHEYIQTARAKGLHERTVIFVHALKNALIPVATGLGSLLVGLVSGSFVIEKIFSIPGMGDIFIVAVGARDYTTIMGVTIFYSFLLIIGYLLVDILYTWLDPRIRFD